MMLDERHEDWDDRLRDCAECSAECRPEELERVNRRLLCSRCADMERVCESVPITVRDRYRRVGA